MARCRRCLRAAQDAAQPLEMVERPGHLRADYRRSGCRTRRGEDRHDRCNLPESPPDSDQHGRQEGGRGRLIGRTKGGMNTKLHTICDSQGRSLDLFVTAGQVSDYIGARALVNSLPKAEWLLGDRGYDADWFREALKDKCIRACISCLKQRNKAVKNDQNHRKRRTRIKAMFGRLKDWRRVATRYDRCPKVFPSAIALAALVIYWPCVLIPGAVQYHACRPVPRGSWGL